MGILNFLGALSPAYTMWVTWLPGAQKTGQDHLGNVYYRAKPRRGYKRDRRWVIYDGAPEASKVPPEWHGWLHHQSDKIPEEGGESFRRPWQKPHLANMTGTAAAWLPPALKGGKRDPATGDYEAWQPPE